MRHILPSRVSGGSIRTGAMHGARRGGERVCAIGFHQGPGAIDRQAGLSAAADRRAGAAPRGSGADHRLPAHHLRRRRSCRCSIIAAGDRRSDPRHRRIADFARRAPRPAGRDGQRASTHAPANLARARCSPARAIDVGRVILLSNADGIVIAPRSAPTARSIGRSLIDVLGRRASR